MIPTVDIPSGAPALSLSRDRPRYTSDLETKIICWYARSTVGDLLEIGCNQGVTTVELALHCHPRKVVAVDYSGPDYTVRGEQEREVPSEHMVCRFARHLENVQIVNQKSETLDLNRWNLGFAFIDGDHSYRGVAKDTELVISYFRANPANRPAAILWHDYLDASWCGVKRLLNERASELELFHLAGTHLVIWSAPSACLTAAPP